MEAAVTDSFFNAKGEMYKLIMILQTEVETNVSGSWHVRANVETSLGDRHQCTGLPLHVS